MSKKATKPKWIVVPNPGGQPPHYLSGDYTTCTRPPECVAIRPAPKKRRAK